MTNYNKHGYSTSEVAQILGCTPCTVRVMINDGRLKAHVTSPNKSNGYRNISISREHIQDYIKANPDRFTDADRKAWGVCDKQEVEPMVESLPNKPTGAWRDLFETEKKDLGIKAIESKPLVEEIKESAKEPHYSVMVSGRIAVAGITKDTAITIITALLNDTGSACFNDVAIKVNK